MGSVLQLLSETLDTSQAYQHPATPKSLNLHTEAFSAPRLANVRSIACTQAGARTLPEFKFHTGGRQMQILKQLWRNDEGQDIAEYALMLAVILVLVIVTVQAIGTNANSVFSKVASAIK